MVSPSLLIRRVVVEGELSCDLPFDHGLNIVQAVPKDGDPKSTNSTGKTALVELIQHGLGKNQDSKAKWHFKPIIDQVKTLWLEIEANGEILTIERSLQQINAAASVRQGPYIPGIEKLPYELVPIDQMSPLILNVLGIPNVSVRKLSGELDPLSFPLLMRAFILHQEDSFGAILHKVQPDQRRADIIGFLSGITPLARFELEGMLTEVQIETQRLENYFQSVQKFLIENGVPSLIEAEAQKAIAEQNLTFAKEEQLSIQREIRMPYRILCNGVQQEGAKLSPALASELFCYVPLHKIRYGVRNKREANGEFDSRGIGRIDSLRSRLLGIKEDTAFTEHELTGRWQEEERLKEVLASLQSDRRKVQRIKASSTILNSIDFSICPRCLQDITPEMRIREQYARCCLCNRPLTTTSDAPPKAMPRTEDIDLQIEEAEAVLKDIHQEIETLLNKLGELRTLEAEIGKNLEEEVQVYVSPSVDLLIARAHEVAQYEAEYVQAQALLNQARALIDIKNELEELQLRQASLEEQLKEARKPNKERLEEFRQIYEHILRAIDFPNFQNCSINPYTLMPDINGSLYSTTGTAFKGLATVCYHLALLELARREQTYFPLLLVIDSPAVGDMNEESEDKLLRYLATLQSNSEQEYEDSNNLPDWQIILTTRRIIHELEPYVKVKISQAPNQMLLRRHL